METVTELSRDYKLGDDGVKALAAALKKNPTLLQETEPLYREYLSIDKQAFGNNHPVVARVLSYCIVRQYLLARNILVEIILMWQLVSAALLICS